jgi:hypothetical protein
MRLALTKYMRWISFLSRMGDVTKNATNIVVDLLARLIYIQEVPASILVLGNNSFFLLIFTSVLLGKYLYLKIGNSRFSLLTVALDSVLYKP